MRTLRTAGWNSSPPAISQSDQVPGLLLKLKKGKILEQPCIRHFPIEEIEIIPEFPCHQHRRRTLPRRGVQIETGEEHAENVSVRTAPPFFFSADQSPNRTVRALFFSIALRRSKANCREANRQNGRRSFFACSGAPGSAGRFSPFPDKPQNAKGGKKLSDEKSAISSAGRLEDGRSQLFVSQSERSFSSSAQSKPPVEPVVLIYSIRENCRPPRQRVPHIS